MHVENVLESPGKDNRARVVVVLCSRAFAHVERSRVFINASLLMPTDTIVGTKYPFELLVYLLKTLISCSHSCCSTVCMFIC